MAFDCSSRRGWAVSGDVVDFHGIVISYHCCVQSWQDKADVYKQTLLAHNISVSPPVPFAELNLMYNRARTVYIPCTPFGGGERAVMEAKAAGAAVEVEPDNPKLRVISQSLFLLFLFLPGPVAVPSLLPCGVQELVDGPVLSSREYAENISLAIGMAVSGGRGLVTVDIQQVRALSAVVVLLCVSLAT